MSFIKRFFGKNDDGEMPEFKALLESSMEALSLQTEGHQAAWHLGEAKRWDFSQDTGELVFSFPNWMARTPAQVIGSFNQQAGTWMWSWANETIESNLTRDSLRVREYGEKHHIQQLITASWRGSEEDAWRMAALANWLCGSNGVYRGPAGHTFVFFTFGEVQIAKET